MGDRIVNLNYEILMGRNEACKVLCSRQYSANELNAFRRHVKDQYRVQWLLDNLPAASPRMVKDPDTGKENKVYELGFPLGQLVRIKPQNPKDKTIIKYSLNNHVKMTIFYHQQTIEDVSTYRVVGFEVHAQSIHHEPPIGDKRPSTCTASSNSRPVLLDKTGTVVWTYDVQWEASNIKWAYRWDVYLYMTDGQIHWFSIINSLVIVLFLTGMIAMIMFRTIHQDFARYSELQKSDEAQEEYGWKLLHGDVFRPPNHPMMLSVCVGTGSQMLAMSFAAMFFGLLGFLSPANRGGLLTAVLLMFVFMGVFAGYTSSRLYKMLKGQGWKRCTILTSTLVPGVIFLIFFILNFFIWGKKSSGAIPFTTLIALLALWFGVSVPLVFAGSYIGYKKPTIEHPCRVNQIPRQIPEQSWYLSPVISVLVGGILPFGAVFIELSFILSSIWLHHFYYVFGFLFLVLVIMIVTCGEIAIVLCYFQLCYEDYDWWWRSFATPGASALYMFIYSIYYFVVDLEIHSFVSALLFFSYTLIMCIVFFMVTGTIGFFSCLWFLHKIYGSIKID
eukprot:TRINITY_DN1883_c0_g1_i7.p1 TRINITY_DN1883_c0_g1~~TRINITY_DN1883_c0_g1_i7.p1  ORF type:complete len:559 (-),score=86.86 TRINITY_DN1883_c0_g1_i7:159-1835(-)